MITLSVKYKIKVKRNIINYITKSLVYVTNGCFSKDSFFDRLKIIKFSPYTKEAKIDANNYRPNCILTAFTQIKKIVSVRLTNNLLKMNITSEHLCSSLHSKSTIASDVIKYVMLGKICLNHTLPTVRLL